MTNNNSAFSTIATSDLDSVVGGRRDPGGSCDDGSGTSGIGVNGGGIVGGAISTPPGPLPGDLLGQSSAPRPPTGPLDQSKPTPLPHVGKPQ